MATYLDNDVYAKFRGSEDLAALSDTFHSAIDALEPQPDPGLAAHLGGGPAESAVDGALPSPEPPSPPPQVAPQPVPPADAASTSTLPAPDAPVTAPLQAPAPTGGAVVAANQGGREGFKQSFAPYADYAARILGIDPSIVTSMAISESGGGNIPGNSFFGMKGSPYASGSINLPTWELVNGQRVNINDNFATFASPKDAIDAWIDFLQKHTPGVFGAKTPEAFAAGLKAGGYMTDTAAHYAATLRNLGAQPGGGEPSGAIPSLPAAPQAAPAETGAQAPTATPASSGGLASGLQSLSDAFHQKIDDLGTVAGQVKDTGAATIQQLATDFHQKINDLGATAPAANEVVQQGILKYGPVAQTQNVIKALGSMGLLAGAENPNVSDQELANHAIMALSFGSEGGAKFDKYGVEQGFVPPAAKDITPPEPAAPAPAPASKPIGDVWNTPAAMEPLPPRAPPPEPTPAVTTPTENPFALSAEPGPGRVPLDEQGLRDHITNLTTRYETNDARIQELESSLSGGGLAPTGVVRVPGIIGWSDAEVIAYARQNGLNPYSTDGWPQMRGDASKIAGSRPSLPNAGAKLSPPQARAELKRLYAEQDQLLSATEVPEGATTLYQTQPPEASDLPWNAYTEPANGPAAEAAHPAAAAIPVEPARVGSNPANPRPTPESTSAPAAAGRSTSSQAVAAHPVARELPPPETFDVNGNQLTGPTINDIGQARQTVEATKSGIDKTPVSSTGIGADLPLGGRKGPWSPVFADGGHVMPSAEGAVGPELPATELPGKAGITPETMAAAYQRIEQALGRNPDAVDTAISKLDHLIASGATPDAVARHMAEVAGQKVNLASVVRTVRTGSLAGGLTTEGKVALSPIIQTAMRAPVAAVKAIVTGKAGDIPTGLQGGLAGLAEGAADGLQTIRYGINYRAALTGAAEGGYGFKPGLDVLGSNAATRLAGAAAMGLVRTHGAVADLSAGIGRGAAKATGATPAAAAEVGQQWAFRSGNYGTVGKFVADQIGDLRRVNPAMDIASQIILPFYRVGYNVLTQGVERSPLGLVGTGIDVARGKLGSGPYRANAANKAVTPVGDRLANNMFGVGLASLGLAQASAGIITGENPQGGAPRWSVRVAGAWLPLRTLGPAGEALAQSAALYEGVRDGRGDVAKMAQRSATEYAGHIFDESWLRSVTDALALVGDVAHMSSSYAPTAAGSAKDFAYQGGKIAKSFIPQQKLGEQLLGAVQPASRTAPAPAGGGRRSAPVPLGRKPTPRR